MTQIATDPSQSARLLDCGLDPKSADMCYLYWDESGEQLSREEYLENYNESFLDGRIELVPKDFGDYDHSYENDSPAWSLSALLSLLPETITKGNTVYYLDLAPYDHEYWKWGLGYFSTKGIRTVRMLSRAADLIEVCVEAIVWLLENGYKLNEIKR